MTTQMEMELNEVSLWNLDHADFEADHYSKITKNFCLENDVHTGFCIRVHTNQGTYFDIDDLSTDEAAVDELIEWMNTKNLSIVHLSDVIEDFLS